MDQGTTGMISAGNGVTITRKPDPVPETPAQLENDIEEIRNHLGDVAGELDRRRHRLFDLRGQVRKRAKPIAIGAAALAAMGLGLLWWRSRSRRTAGGRLVSSLRARLPEGAASGEWFDGLRARVAETIHPTPPTHAVRSSLVKISTAGAAAVVSVLGKHLAGQLASGQGPVAPHDPDDAYHSTDYTR